MTAILIASLFGCTVMTLVCALGLARNAAEADQQIAQLYRSRQRSITDDTRRTETTKSNHAA